MHETVNGGGERCETGTADNTRLNSSCDRGNGGKKNWRQTKYGEKGKFVRCILCAFAKSKVLNTSSVYTKFRTEINLGHRLPSTTLYEINSVRKVYLQVVLQHNILLHITWSLSRIPRISGEQRSSPYFCVHARSVNFSWPSGQYTVYCPLS